MANTILVLDDEADRSAAMRNALSTSLPQHKAAFVDNAPDAIDWLARHLDEAVLISLDHDLGPNRERDGQLFDPGVGRDVVEHLVTQKPVCPVIIHSTNSPAAYGMKARLKESAWTCSRVVPFNDLEWIEAAWLPKVNKHLLATERE